jgi:hypothetical protein
MPSKILRFLYVKLLINDLSLQALPRRSSQLNDYILPITMDLTQPAAFFELIVFE